MSLVLYAGYFSFGIGVLVNEAAEAGLVTVLDVAAFCAAVCLCSLVLASDGYREEYAGTEEACEGRSGDERASGHPELSFF